MKAGSHQFIKWQSSSRPLHQRMSAPPCPSASASVCTASMGKVGVGVVEAGEPEKEKEILRVKSAQSIQPGCQQWVIAAWAPKETKPQKRHLQEEVARRGGAVVKTWTPQQLADWLLVKPAVGPLCAGSVVVETVGVEASSRNK